MNALSRFLRVEFRPPNFLLLPTAGIDISTSGIKVALISETMRGYKLASYGELMLPVGSVVGGEIADRKAVIKGLRTLAKKHHIQMANVALPESRGYLFQAPVPKDISRDGARVHIEQRLEEYVPLPAPEVVFDFVRVQDGEKQTRAIGMGYSRRVIDETISVVEEAGIMVRAVESETFALPRAVLQRESTDTVLLVDIGKTTTKLMVISDQVPRYVTTLPIGGHALTLAVTKYFGVSEEEAKKVKAERGIVPDKENEEYLAAMISTVSVIKDEILTRVEYWKNHAKEEGGDIARALLVGGNAAIKGLPEYLQEALSVPVSLGDTFTNLIPRKVSKTPLSEMESLAYGTAIGLALRTYES